MMLKSSKIPPPCFTETEPRSSWPRYGTEGTDPSWCRRVSSWVSVCSASSFASVAPAAGSWGTDQRVKNKEFILSNSLNKCFHVLDIWKYVSLKRIIWMVTFSIVNWFIAPFSYGIIFQSLIIPTWWIMIQPYVHVISKDFKNKWIKLLQ